MRIAAISAALAASIALIAAGCQKQPQQAAPQSAPSVAHAAAAPAPADAQNTAPKATPVLVSSTAAPAPKAAQAPSASQETSQPPSSQLDLPQFDDSFALQGPARAALEAALSRASGAEPVLLPDESVAALMASASDDFRNSCRAMISNWTLSADGTAKWSVRVLFSLRPADRPGATQAVLAFRCAPTSDQQYFDERPAIVSLTPEAATLKFIPLALQQDGEETLFHVGFSQAFTAVGAQLVELNVYHSLDNPCCGGADEESGNRRVALDLATGKPVLDVVANQEHDSHDDSVDGPDVQHICDGKIRYERDAAGNVTSISVETHCKDNGKPRPAIAQQLFRWNSDTRQFDPVK
jgi:hypothetical protein